MVDCGNSRCTQERRVFKKELLSWSKKVPLLCGLELVAEELGGRRLLDVLLQPYSELDPGPTEDWEPSDCCTYCHTKFSSCLDSSSSEQENGPENTGVRYLPSMLPLSLSSVLPDSHPTTPCDGEPLDLSASSPAQGRSPTPSGAKPVVELKVPMIHSKTGKKKEFGGKRAYTEEELQAAVSDIRSGKIGTRRAAVLYGIPRSTLRNKIFKMDTSDFSLSAEHKLSMTDLLQGMPNGDYMSFYGGEENKISLMSDEEWERKLAQIRRKHNLLDLDRKFGMPPLYFNSREGEELDKGFGLSNHPYAHELKLPFLPELVRKMAEERMQMERQLQSSSQVLQLDLSMSRGMHGMPLSPPVELKIPSYKPMRSFANGFTNGNAEDSSNSESPPAPSNNNNHSNRIGDTLKDIIAKTIAEKVRSRAQMNNCQFTQQYNSLPGLSARGPMENGMNSGDEPLGPQPSKRAKPGPKPRVEHSHSEKKSELEGEKPMKKTRPKRGQYRKYNSQLLLEAVKAVQRGEMSVHRAGSYFGVPHSTLEYKVKERHLLRQKKPRESRKKQSESVSINTTDSNGSNSGNISSSSSSSETGGLLSGSTYQSALQSMALTGALPLTLAWAQPPNGNLPLLHPDPAFSAYNSGFALNTSASELLKKLQQKVQAKSAVDDTSRKTGIPDPVTAQ